MRKFSGVLAIFLVAAFFLFAAGSSEESEKVNQGNGSATQVQQDQDANRLGEYSVVIDSCRIAKDYEDQPVVIVKYIFTNVADDDAAAFSWCIDEAVYQNGIGLNESYFLDNSANYSSDNQSKEIKKGATIEVEVAYKLNDNFTPIEVEVKELFSFTDKTLTKTFDIS